MSFGAFSMFKRPQRNYTPTYCVVSIPGAGVYLSASPTRIVNRWEFPLSSGRANGLPIKLQAPTIPKPNRKSGAISYKSFGSTSLANGSRAVFLVRFLPAVPG